MYQTKLLIPCAASIAWCTTSAANRRPPLSGNKKAAGFMKQFSTILFPFLVLFISGSAHAQIAQPAVRHKIAIFAPLYLDSAFDASQTYRFGNNFPRFSNPGLEFYQGAQMALDSLQKIGAPLDVYVYDSRSETRPLQQALKNAEIRDAEMLIGHGTQSDVRVLAE